ncbi:MAG TPA: ATP-binding protein [Phycisphaerae bacterium]|nr:ATP-binding protein [Phycisphaerae bacterium]
MSSDINRVELTIHSDPRNLPIVRAAVEKLAALEGFEPHDVYHITLAIDEALANVIKHGYGGKCDQPIVITLQPVRSPDGRPGISVCVRDQGRQVDPALIKGRDLEEVRPGGLGVHIIQSVMDAYNYSCPVDGGMLLEMVKYASAKNCPSPSVKV